MISMPFGRHRGSLIEELPDGYLRWLLTIDIETAELREAIEAEAEARGLFGQRHHAHSTPPRGARPPVAVADEVIEAGRRSLARKYHPDLVGGYGGQMKLVNGTADWLRAQARALA